MLTGMSSQLHRLPDSAVDLMDEACASARVAQDMKPEAIDTLEQDLLHVEAHIKTLEVSVSVLLDR